MTLSLDCGIAESPALIAVLDQTMTCVDLSRQWREHLQLAESDVAGLSLEGLFGPCDDNALQDDFEAVLGGGPPVHQRQVAFPGEAGPGSGQLSAWRASYADDKPCVVVLVADATELEEAIRELTRVQTEQQLILDAAGEGIYGLDQDGKLTFGNAATSDILGWRVDDILMQSAHDVHHHSHEDGSPYPREECPIYAALRDGEVHRVDTEVFWHTNGKPVPIEYTSTPILKDGNPDGAVVIFRDISERRESERQREADYAEIQALKEELER